MLYFQNTERVIQEKLSVMRNENQTLKGLAGKINELNTTQNYLMGLSQQMEQAVAERSYWVRLLTEINSKFDNDLVWLTVMEPLKDSKPITPQLVTQGETSTPKDEPTNAEPVYALQMQGLYRKNDEGEQVVYRFAAELAKSPWFGIEDFEAKRADYVSAQSGVEEDRYAYSFNIRLPLKQPMKFKN